MTTLTIEIPDDDNLSESEFQSLQNACEEAVLIKKGLSKAIPASELWNDYYCYNL